MVAILFVFLIITRKPYFFLRKFYFFWNHTHFTMMKIHPLNHKNKISLKTPRILSLKVNLGKYGSNWTLKLLKQIRHLVFHWIYKILWNRFYFFDSGWELELHVWAHSTEPSLIAVSCSWNNIFEWHEFLWYIQHSVVSTIKKKKQSTGFLLLCDFYNSCNQNMSSRDLWTAYGNFILIINSSCQENFQTLRKSVNRTDCQVYLKKCSY